MKNWKATKVVRKQGRPSREEGWSKIPQQSAARSKCDRGKNAQPVRTAVDKRPTRHDDSSDSAERGSCIRRRSPRRRHRRRRRSGSLRSTAR